MQSLSEKLEHQADNIEHDGHLNAARYMRDAADALRLAASQQSPASGAEQMRDACANWIKKRWEDYCAEHGSFDPETGVTEYPGNGDEWIEEMQEIEEALRAMPLPPSPAPGLDREAQIESIAKFIDPNADWDAPTTNSEHPGALCHESKMYSRRTAARRLAAKIIDSRIFTLQPAPKGENQFSSAYATVWRETEPLRETIHQMADKRAGTTKPQHSDVREALKVALYVLCSARDGQSWSANFLKNFEIAIEGVRAALTATKETDGDKR